MAVEQTIYAEGALSDGEEMDDYDLRPRQQRQIWFWLNLVGTKEKEQVLRVHTSIILIFA